MSLSDFPPYVPDGIGQFVEFLRELVGDDLRSVIWHDPGDFEVVYAREDVLTAYSDGEIEDVVDELLMTSFSKSVKERVYTHGELECLVEYYEDGVEMHVILEGGEGIAVGFDRQAVATHETFVGKCLAAADREVATVRSADE